MATANHSIFPLLLLTNFMKNKFRQIVNYVQVFQSSVDVSNFSESSEDMYDDADENEDDKENCKPNHGQPKPAVQSRCCKNYCLANALQEKIRQWSSDILLGLE